MTDKKTGSQFNFKLNFWPNILLSLLIFINLTVGTVAFSKTGVFLTKKTAENKEAARPAELNLINLVDLNCQDCFTPQLLIEVLKKENTNIVSKRTIDINSSEGAQLIQKFKIDKVPTLIVSGEIDKEATLKKLWPKIGEVINKTFVLRRVGAPYVDLQSREVRGRVSLTVLADKSCGECYNPAVHERILAKYGWPANFIKRMVDIQDADGRALIQKYNIKLIPTIILEGDLDVYPVLKKVWSQVGSVETDGAYVFRQGVKQMGVYKNLATNQIVKPQSKVNSNK